MLQQVQGHPFDQRQARLRALGLGLQQVFADQFDQRLGVDTQGIGQLGLRVQRAVARRAVDLRHGDEQRAGQRRALYRQQLAPGFEHLGEPCNVVLAHLVAARAAEQQRYQVGLLDAQAGGVLGQFVAHRETMHAALVGQLVQLVEFQPKPLGDRAVQLAGADQRAAQAADRPLDTDREQLRAVAAVARRFLDHDQLVADGQVVLQGLAEVGDFARPFVEDDSLVEEVPFQVGADEMHLWTEQFEQLQAGLDGQHQLVEFDQALVELARGFPEVGLGQVRQPVLDVLRGGVAEAQVLLRRSGDAQREVGALVFHGGLDGSATEKALRGGEAPERCRTSDRRGCASSFLTREAGSSSWPGQELCGSPPS